MHSVQVCKNKSGQLCTVCPIQAVKIEWCERKMWALKSCCTEGGVDVLLTEDFLLYLCICILYLYFVYLCILYLCICVE